MIGGIDNLIFLSESYIFLENMFRNNKSISLSIQHIIAKQNKNKNKNKFYAIYLFSLPR